jgi:hypothetical protein
MSRPRLSGLARSFRKTLVKRVMPDAVFIRRQYRMRTGRTLDLANPTGLAEKVQWLKLHDRSPLHTICADKIRARDYVAAHLGPDVLTPCFGVTYDPGALTPSTVRAARFVAKSNHDQGGVFICKDRAAFDWEATRAELRRRLAVNKYYEFRERQYRDIRPGVLVEAYLEGADGANVRELKVYCFHGRPVFVQLVLDRFENKREAFYDLDWRRLPFRAVAAPLEGPHPRPRALGHVLGAAAALARPFLFVRIDFLDTGEAQARFGEVTFHFGAGLIRFDPEEFDLRYGALIDLARLPETRGLQRAALARIAGGAERPPPLLRGGTPAAA